MMATPSLRIEAASARTSSSTSTPGIDNHEGKGKEGEKRAIFCGKGLRMLVWLNLVMCLFHTALVVVTLVLGNLALSVPVYNLSYDLDVTTNNSTEATGDGGDESRGWKLIPKGGAVVMNLKFTWMTAAFFAISALFHFGNALVWRKWYLEGISKARCPSRWIEYTFSASLMSVLIAYGAGTNLLLVLVAIFFLTAVTMFFGHLTEVIARPEEATNRSTWSHPWYYRLQAHFMGYVPQITAWFLIMYSFHKIAAEAKTTITTPDGETKTYQMPKFVYGIVWGEVFVFWSFGIIQLVVTLAPPRYYPYGELAYQIMSLASKGLLGLILIVNVLMLSEFEDAFD